MSNILLRKPFILILLLLCLSGCGGSSQNKQTIALDPQWFGLELPGKEKNLVGLCTDLIQEISTEQSINLAILESTGKDLLFVLKTNKAQGILSSMQPYGFLAKTYDFSEPVLKTGPVLVVPVSSSVSAVDDLSGKEVAVISGGIGSLVLEKNPQIIIREYPTIPDALNDLVIGNVDAALINGILAYSYCQDLYQGQLKVASDPLNNEGLRLVVLHGENQALMESFQDGMRVLKKNGKYSSLMEKWGFPALASGL